jgi:FtsH-binding integral membrane protein
MSNRSSHSESYFVKLLIGFGAIISSILVIFYAIFEVNKNTDWYYWAIFAAFLLCGGIYFALSAFVHKIKSDFSRRSSQREAHKSKLNNE